MTFPSSAIRWAALLGAGLLATGCAKAHGVMQRLHEPPMDLASGDEQQVKVRTPFYMDNPQWVADHHCKRFGRTARRTETAKTYALFDCVEPNAP